MINSKELLVLMLSVIVLAFSNSFLNSALFIVSLVYFAIILAVYITGKKLIAYYLEIQTQEKVWSFQRYWLGPRDYVNIPIPIGLILPFLFAILSMGYAKWFAVTTTEVKTTPARAVKRHDFYSFAELTEWHLACISSAGVILVMITSFFAYLLNFPELAKLCIYFSFFNMLPLPGLDGSKVFFGSRILYYTLGAIVLIALGYALLLV